ncbi:MAG: deoxyhypusine synthase family protein [Candidatus Omnitrophica bacterium]|nr:deoxyhypusine synthase family protein [Candidatus Omnitrophota bacterium]MDD5527084.1 deoxyhypusine synthase family protein [Candidatus Omnitrophota bacterium]
MVDLSRVKTYSVKTRKSKVSAGDFAQPPRKGAGFRSFFSSLPNILRAADLRSAAEAAASAGRRKKAVIFMAGAHVIKCGLGPVIIELIKKRVISCVCLNGAGVIHDFEIALQGRTSEDVASGLAAGRFGMGRETAEFINNAVNAGASCRQGFGYAVGSRIRGKEFPHSRLSVLRGACDHGVPVCVHVAVGTDIIHQHPSFDPAAAGKASYADFLTLVKEIRGLNGGGVLLNFGSAVIMPEVFLKALNLARNLGSEVKDFTAVNFDMIHQYRPAQNIVCRPVLSGGKGYYIIGHHEIMLPLFAQAVVERL